MNPKVDAYIDREESWRAEVRQLRAILLGCPLEETLKWGTPCYTHGKRNIVLIHTFKEYCALLFFKGALLKDPESILVQQTKNTQATRQIRFTNTKEIKARKSIVTAYVQEAIEVEKAGLKVPYKETDAFEVPAEFQARLDADLALKNAFAALTPGRQRAYLLHFAGAKQSKIRASRVAQCAPRILAGKGLKD